jgi:MFS transporter, PAT family, beta-lactamase induction signal transducer AmpG
MSRKPIPSPSEDRVRSKPETLSGFRLLASAMKNRKTAIMFVFGFAAGLPYTLLLGTLYAWLGEAKVDLATIGILSWIGLAYAFKFLWSPVVDRVNLPVLGRMGRRRGWLVVCQVLLAVTFVLLSLTDPVLALGWFALIAVISAFASATQDVVIDAWRIDVADDVATLEILSTIYQFGYRVAALVGGALALVLAARISWPTVYALMGGLMLVALVATLLAPDTARPLGDGALTQLRQSGAIDPRLRAVGLAIVGAGWTWAIVTIAVFMVRVLMASPDDPSRPVAGDFTRRMGPWIVVATVIVPSLVAAYFNWLREGGRNLLKGPVPVSGSSRAADHAYSALILPLEELIGRLKWGAVLALGLILSYRLCDSIWGPFAFPFYLEELKYTNDEVAFASKIFGVFMTMAGIALGGILFATLGRMPTLTIGAATAAASNLLYADLAAGAPVIDALATMTGLTSLGEALGTDARMIRLMLAISGENIAGGLAGAAFVAYLSSIASKSFSAVQYALLSSLTFLVGSLGRGALGEAIKLHGYAPVFKFTAALGLIAVIFCLLEWLRAARERRRETTAEAMAGRLG